jgi:hypothetical protein
MTNASQMDENGRVRTKAHGPTCCRRPAGRPSHGRPPSNPMQPKIRAYPLQYVENPQLQVPDSQQRSDPVKPNQTISTGGVLPERFAENCCCLPEIAGRKKSVRTRIPDLWSRRSQAKADGPPPSDFRPPPSDFRPLPSPWVHTPTTVKAQTNRNCPLWLSQFPS